MLTESELPEDLDGELRWVDEHLPGGDFETAGWMEVSALSERHIAPDEERGSFHAIDEAATLLPLSVDGWEPRPQDPEMPPRRGISGAPVLVTSGPGAGKVYGVIRKGPSSRPDRLWAVSSPALLRNADFREKLGLDVPSLPPEKLVLNARRCLKANPDVARRIAYGAPAWREAWDSGSPAAGVDGFLAAFCQTVDLDALFEVLKAVRPSDEERSSFERIARYLTALAVDRTCGEKGFRLEQAGGKWRVPVMSSVFAEAMLAATYGTAPSYGWKNGQPVPRLRLPDVHLEAGIDRKGEAVERVEEMAQGYIRDGLCGQSFLRPDELRLISNAAAGRDHHVRAKAVEHGLRREKQQKGRAPFVEFLRPPTDLDRDRSNDNDRREAVQQELKKLLPSLEIVELSGDAEEALDLNLQLEPLWGLLRFFEGGD
ncbi:MAG: hypothetical protein AAGM22_33000 [Acidobacteriota bacterium]